MDGIRRALVLGLVLIAGTAIEQAPFRRSPWKLHACTHNNLICTYSHIFYVFLEKDMYVSLIMPCIIQMN